jgi:FkbM family methyltransferase
MSRLKGCIYWLLSASPLASALGKVLHYRPFDWLGPLELPEGISPKIVSGIAFGLYEYSERYLIRKWLPHDVNVVELGGSIGIVSREILRCIKPERSLIVVEAIPKLAKLVKKNVGSIYPTTCWQPIQAAVAYGCADVPFVTGSEHIAGRIGRDGKGMRLRATTLSSIVQDFQLTDFSLVMDIEGAEHEVVRHDLSALARCQCVIAELHGEQTDKDAFCRKLQEIGLTLVERKHSVVAFLRK